MKTIFVLIGIITVAEMMCARSQSSRMGRREMERWETTNNTFKVRVIAHPEEGGLVSGAYYIFESAADYDWREIMIVHHDDPVKIPRQQIRFVSDHVGYAFMLYNYAVTVDGGVTWSVWYAPRDLPHWQDTRANIEDVRVLSDGSGKMSLRSSTDKAAPELHTMDYGKHWTTQNATGP